MWIKLSANIFIFILSIPKTSSQWSVFKIITSQSWCSEKFHFRTLIIVSKYHSWLTDQNREPFASERNSLTTNSVRFSQWFETLYHDGHRNRKQFFILKFQVKLKRQFSQAKEFLLTIVTSTSEIYYSKKIFSIFYILYILNEKVKKQLKLAWLKINMEYQNEN